MEKKISEARFLEGAVSECPKTAYLGRILCNLLRGIVLLWLMKVVYWGNGCYTWIKRCRFTDRLESQFQSHTTRCVLRRGSCVDVGSWEGHSRPPGLKEDKLVPSLVGVGVSQESGNLFQRVMESVGQDTPGFSIV